MSQNEQESTQTGFSTAHLLKDVAEVSIQAGQSRPRVRVQYDDRGEAKLPQIVYVTRTVNIPNEGLMKKAGKALKPVLMHGVVNPVTNVGFFALFVGRLMAGGVKLWGRSYRFLLPIFNQAFLNAHFVVLALLILSIPGLVAYYGSMYIRPLYDFYHQQEYLKLGLASFGIVLGASLVLSCLVGIIKFVKDHVHVSTKSLTTIQK
jgi:hypothetical protein